MTEEIRPICLYIETCLDKKEGTRDCAKCEHHLNYWTEVMIRDVEKNITRLEQENERLKILEDFLIKPNKETEYNKTLKEISRIINLAHKTEDYLLGQDYTDLVDRIQKELDEVL